MLDWSLPGRHDHYFKAIFELAAGGGFAGTMGMQRRRIWALMADPDYNCKLFVDCAPMRFKKSMEGWGVIALNPAS